MERDAWSRITHGCFSSTSASAAAQLAIHGKDVSTHILPFPMNVNDRVTRSMPWQALGVVNRSFTDYQRSVKSHVPRIVGCCACARVCGIPILYYPIKSSDGSCDVEKKSEAVIHNYHVAMASLGLSGSRNIACAVIPNVISRLLLTSIIRKMNNCVFVIGGQSNIPRCVIPDDYNGRHVAFLDDRGHPRIVRYTPRPRSCATNAKAVSVKDIFCGDVLGDKGTVHVVSELKRASICRKVINRRLLHVGTMMKGASDFLGGGAMKFLRSFVFSFHSASGHVRAKCLFTTNSSNKSVEWWRGAALVARFVGHEEIYQRSCDVLNSFGMKEKDPRSDAEVLQKLYKSGELKHLGNLAFTERAAKSIKKIEDFVDLAHFMCRGNVLSDRVVKRCRRQLWENICKCEEVVSVAVACICFDIVFPCKDLKPKTLDTLICDNRSRVRDIVAVARGGTLAELVGIKTTTRKRKRQDHIAFDNFRRIAGQMVDMYIRQHSIINVREGDEKRIRPLLDPQSWSNVSVGDAMPFFDYSVQWGHQSRTCDAGIGLYWLGAKFECDDVERMSVLFAATAENNVVNERRGLVFCMPLQGDGHGALCKALRGIEHVVADKPWGVCVTDRDEVSHRRVKNERERRIPDHISNSHARVLIVPSTWTSCEVAVSVYALATATDIEWRVVIPPHDVVLPTNKKNRGNGIQIPFCFADYVKI